MCIPKAEARKGVSSNRAAVSAFMSGFIDIVCWVSGQSGRGQYNKKSEDCYAMLCRLTVLRKPDTQKGDTCAARAYRAETACPLLRIYDENFSGFQLTRISIRFFY